MLAFQYAQFAAVGLLLVFLVGAGTRAAWKARAWRQLSRAEAGALAACLLLALAVRLSATVFPADHSLASMQGSAIGGVHRWAAGYSAVLHLLYLFFPSDVSTAAMFNVAVGTLTVLAVFAFVDAYFEDRLAAFGAAAALAAQPISARYAASDSAHVLLTFCLLAGCFFLALWCRKGGRLALLQGAGWLALAANVRFEACAYVLVGPLLLAGLAPRLGKEERSELLRAGLGYLLFLVHPAWRALTSVSGGQAETFALLGLFGYFFRSPYSPAAVAVVAAAGLAWALFKTPRRALAFLAALAVVSLPTDFEVSRHYDVAHRYVLPHLAGWSVFAGLGLSAALSLLAGGRARVTPPAAAAVLCAVLLAAAPHRGFLTKMWTFALEYRFISEHLRDIPDGCVMVRTDDPGDYESRSLRIGGPLSADAGRGHRWVGVDEVLRVGPEPCTVFYAGVACYAYEPARHAKPDWEGAERPVCRRMREAFALVAIATAALPTVPYQEEAYTASPVPIGFYRVTPR